MSALEYLRQQSRFTVITFALALVVMVGILDSLANPHLSFEIFFLIPIFITVWVAGKGAGILISVASAAVWLTVDAMAKPPSFHSIAPYWNLAAGLGIFGMATLILTALREALEREKALAKTDCLTGAANKRSFLDSIDMEIHRTRRYPHPFTVAYLDIDNFKFINDRLGHTIGDTLLKAMTNAIKNTLRKVDVVARVGGDEFAILLPETPTDQAELAIRKIRRSLLKVAQRNEWPVTFSMGVVTFNSPPHSSEELLEKADTLMCSAKKNGRNTVQYEVCDSTNGD